MSNMRGFLIVKSIPQSKIIIQKEPAELYNLAGSSKMALQYAYV